MVDRRHPRPSGQAGPAEVPLYGFQPPVGTPYGLEVSTVEDFFAQHDDWPWNPPRPGRATFHYLIAVTEGALRHDVDHSRFVDALELNFRELHRAADYADLLGSSVRTLSRAAREATGKGVRELIDERRLLEARRLLGDARWDARAVAAHLGFTDPANFGRFFRDRTGIPPAAFAAREATTGP